MLANNALEWSVIAAFAIRIVGGIAAVGCFFAGLWFVWSDPGQGVILIALGTILGVIFGRYPAGAGGAPEGRKTDAD